MPRRMSWAGYPGVVAYCPSTACSNGFKYTKILRGRSAYSILLSFTTLIDRGGPAEMVAGFLDSRIRDHLVSRNNLFTEAGHMGTSFQRPVLCLFDRNFELSVAVQHVWSYRPLVHDVLNMKLNRVNVQGEGKRIGYDLDDGDSFWVANGNALFPQVAQEVEVRLSRSVFSSH